MIFAYDSQIGRIAHLFSVVRAYHRDDDAILVATLASVRRQDLNAIVPLQMVAEELDLLPVERDDADLFFANA